MPSAVVPARYIRDQTVRLIDIADTLCRIRAGGDILILLPVVVAESVAKLWFACKGDGQSKQYVRRFFLELCRSHVQEALLTAVRQIQHRRAFPFGEDSPVLFGRDPVRIVQSVEEVLALLYSVRCDVAHEGKYRSLLYVGPIDQTDRDDVERTLALHREIVPMYLALRQCVVRGSIAVLEKCIARAQSPSR